MLPTSAGVEPATPGLKSDAHPTAPTRPATCDVSILVGLPRHNTYIIQMLEYKKVVIEYLIQIGCFFIMKYFL